MPLFEVTVDFQLYELSFSPTKYEVRDAIKSAITEGINTVCRYELFVHQPEFETYVNVQEQEDHLFDDQNDLMSLAIGSDMLIRDTELISSQIDSVYSDMKDFAKVFDYFIQIYNENVNMQVEDFRHKEHEFINQTMNKLISQIEEIEQLDVKGSIRVVRFDGEKMKKRIRESPRNCLRVLQDFIPKF